jgi:hypothetical protein
MARVLPVARIILMAKLELFAAFLLTLLVPQARRIAGFRRHADHGSAPELAELTLAQVESSHVDNEVMRCA